MEKLLTVKEVAEYLNNKPRTLLYWVSANKLQCPVYRLNGKNNYRFRREDVERLLKTDGVKP